MRLIKRMVKNYGQLRGESVRMEARIVVTPEEAALLRVEDPETEFDLYDKALAHSSFYGGPGRAFVFDPGYRELDRPNVFLVYQWAGMDI